MIRIDDIIGKKYGHLTVIREAEPKFYNNDTTKRYRQVLCQCDCNNKTMLTRELHTLIKSNMASCGCARRKVKVVESKPLHGWRFQDLTGKQFTNLRVIEYTRTKRVGKNNAAVPYWKCECVCGNIVEVAGMSLRSGNTKSCGCLHHTTDENGKQQLIACKPTTTHDKSKTRLYRIYRGMVNRCFTESCNAYKDYGARGITVCSDWYNPALRRNTEGFMNFYNWSIANGYHDPLPGQPRKEHLSIDRKDNDGPYAPWNCRWVTMKTQANNQRNTKYFTINGETLPYSAVEEKYGLVPGYISSHLSGKGAWSVDAVAYAILHQDLKIRQSKGKYYDQYHNEIDVSLRS